MKRRSVFWIGTGTAAGLQFANGYPDPGFAELWANAMSQIRIATINLESKLGHHAAAFESI
jgi:hypothetical protein